MLTTEIEGVETGVNFMGLGETALCGEQEVKEFMSLI